MRNTRNAAGVIVCALVAHCMAPIFSAAALAAEPSVPLIDGLYTAAGCPSSGYIPGEASVNINTGNFFGGGHDRYIEFEHLTYCKLSGLKKNGNLLSGNQRCFSGGNRISYEVGPSQISLNIIDSKTFTIQASGQDGKVVGRLSGKTWRWCR